jgi:CubicO group peptidase (beta-lactamase class C family)
MSSTQDSLAAIARFELGDAEVGGVCARYVQIGQNEWTGSWGKSARNASEPPTERTVFRAASVTKMFTGLMLLQLAERGRLRLSDPLEDHVPEFSAVRRPNERARPTLVQLATMTAGLPPEVPDPGINRELPPIDFERAVLAVIPQITMVAEPGIRFAYSNLSYALLGLVCSRAAGAAYHEYIVREILMPLGMTRSGFGPTLGAVDSLAPGYDLTDGEIDATTPEREHRGRGYGLPAGGLYATVEDLGRFARFCLAGNEAVLTNASREFAYDGIVAADRDLNFGEGLGFAALRDLQGRHAATGHFGIVSGYKCGLVFNRETKRALVVCTSITRTADTTDLAREMIEIVSG